MAFNYARERKKFEKEWKRLRSKYTAAGMSLEDIEAMRQFDLKVFNSDRRYFSHTQPLLSSDCGEDDSGQEDKSVLLERFSETMSVTDDGVSFHGRYWWIEELDTPELIQAIKMLSDNDKELLTLYFFDGYSQSEIAEFYGISQKTSVKKYRELKKIYAKGYKKRLLAAYHMRR